MEYAKPIFVTSPRFAFSFFIKFSPRSSHHDTQSNAFPPPDKICAEERMLSGEGTKCVFGDQSADKLTPKIFNDNGKNGECQTVLSSCLGNFSNGYLRKRWPFNKADKHLAHKSNQIDHEQRSFQY